MAGRWIALAAVTGIFFLTNKTRYNGVPKRQDHFINFTIADTITIEVYKARLRREFIFFILKVERKTKVSETLINKIQK